MSIQSRFRTYKLYKQGKDSLGAINKAGTYIQDVEASISLITGTSLTQNSLFYSESTHTAIVNDKSIIFEKGSTVFTEPRCQSFAKQDWHRLAGLVTRIC